MLPLRRHGPSGKFSGPTLNPCFFFVASDEASAPSGVFLEPIWSGQDESRVYLDIFLRPSKSKSEMAGEA